MVEKMESFEVSYDLAHYACGDETPGRVGDE